MAKSAKKKKSSKKTTNFPRKSRKTTGTTGLSKVGAKKKNSTKRTKNKQAVDPFAVASARSLIAQVFKITKKHYKTYLVFIVLYGFFQFILVSGPASVSIPEIRTTLSDVLPEQGNNTALIAGLLIGESANVDETAALYGAFLVLIFTLALIWIIRMQYEGNKVRVRDGFYKGMYGLIPATLVGVVILLQTLPAALGGLIYSIVSINGIANSIPEHILFISIFVLLIVLTLYMLTSSLIAVYIAALPDVTPTQALRTAKELVKYRRAKVFFRIVTGFLLFGLIAFVFLLIAIAFVSGAAVWLWWIVGVLSLPLINAYMYSLYRSLL